jgi:hypothetical protein
MPWSTVPWAASEGHPIPPPATVMAVHPGLSAWSAGDWSGTTPTSEPVTGGVVAVPDPERGVMRLDVWWPDAPTLRLVRVTPDGVRTPVRGAHPLPILGPTRRNLCPNPSVETSLDGYLPSTGNPTLSRITRDDLSGTRLWAWRAQIAQAGDIEIRVPAELPAGKPVTVGVDLRLSTRPSNVRVAVGWVDGAGLPLTPPATMLDTNEVNESVVRFARHVLHPVAPAGAVAARWITITASGMPEHATMDGDQITVEQGYTDGSYLDGAGPGGTWHGHPDTSTSSAAAVLTVDDAECPLDVAVTYALYPHHGMAGAIQTPMVHLPSLGLTWLTHPARPREPLLARPTVTPTLVRGIEQATFPVLGRANPIVVSAAHRRSPTGELALDIATRDEYLALSARLTDGSPLLLRAPADYGYGYGWWIAIGEVTEDPNDRPVWNPARTITLPFTVVDPPA